MRVFRYRKPRSRIKITEDKKTGVIVTKRTETHVI